jgi:hypothetical protein
VVWSSAGFVCLAGLALPTETRSLFRDGVLGHQLTFGHANHNPCYSRILKKTILFSGFENPYKKSAKQENSSLFILQNGKPDINSNPRKAETQKTQKPRLKYAVQEFHLRTVYMIYSSNDSIIKCSTTEDKQYFTSEQHHNFI